MAKSNIDPETEFWKEVRALVLSFAALLERTKLKGVIKISTADVRRAMRDKDRGTEP